MARRILIPEASRSDRGNPSAAPKLSGKLLRLPLCVALFVLTHATAGDPSSAQASPEKSGPLVCVFRPGSDCSGRYLAGLDLRRQNLRGMNFAGANLQDSDFRGADLGGVNFEGANLRRAVFSGAYLGATVFDNADLLGAYLRERDIMPTTSLLGTVMPNGTVCDRTASQGRCLRGSEQIRLPFLARPAR